MFLFHFFFCSYNEYISLKMEILLLGIFIRVYLYPYYSTDLRKDFVGYLDTRRGGRRNFKFEVRVAF